MSSIAGSDMLTNASESDCKMCQKHACDVYVQQARERGVGWWRDVESAAVVVEDRAPELGFGCDVLSSQLAMVCWRKHHMMAPWCWLDVHRCRPRQSGRHCTPTLAPLRPKHAFYFCLCCCYATTQLVLQLHQERTQVVCSNREARKRPAESNATPAMDLGHMNIVLKLFICILVVDLGFVLIIIIIIVIMFRLVLFCVFPPPFFSPPQLLFFLFLHWSSLNVWLRWVCCRGGVACYVECTKW